MNDSEGSARVLAENWASKRAHVSLSFESDRQRSVVIRANARILDKISTSIKFALRPEILSEPPAEYLIVALDGSEQWHEIESDPLGAVRCTRESSGFLLELRVVPTRADLDLDLATSSEQ